MSENCTVPEPIYNSTWSAHPPAGESWIYHKLTLVDVFTAMSYAAFKHTKQRLASEFSVGKDVIQILVTLPQVSSPSLETVRDAVLTDAPIPILELGTYHIYYDPSLPSDQITAECSGYKLYCTVTDIPKAY